VVKYKFADIVCGRTNKAIISAQTWRCVFRKKISRFYARSEALWSSEQIESSTHAVLQEMLQKYIF